MKSLKLLLALTFICLFNAELHCQVTQKTGTYVSGVVIDANDKQPLIGATVIIDGTTKGDITEADGKFSISGLKGGDSLKLQINFIGYKTVTLPLKLKRGANLITEKIVMTSDDLRVDDVIVEGKAPVAIQKGDTTQYNAGAYKTNPDASAEDLLNKMPGFSVTGGVAEVSGETITQVYVDGKSYFKDDVAAALSSLPAGAIESIQLFDEKSDNTRFTGVDDGERAKTINIVTKAKRKNSYFGDYIAGLGYGINNNKNSQFNTREGMLYSLRTNTNIFNGDNRYTIGIGSNNINQAALDGNRYYGAAGSSGLSQSTGVRFNYSGEYKKNADQKTTVGANYRYGNEKNELVKYLEQLNLEQPRLYTELYNSLANNNRHSVRADIESDVNESNKVFFRMWGSIRDNNSNQNTDASTFLNDKLINTSLTRQDKESDAYSIGTNLSWMHRLADKHSISAQGSFRLSKDDSNLLLDGLTTTINSDELKDNILKQDQETKNYSDDNTLGLRLSYTYKLNDKSGLTFNYNNSYNWSDSDRKTYVFDEATGQYTTIDEALSNVFNRDYLTNNGGVGYSYNVKDKVTFSAGGEYQNASLKNNQTFPESKIMTREYSFNSLVANARLDYYFTKNSRLGLFYRGRPELPTVSQLQDVVNNTNPLRVSTGNPLLNQSYNNMLGMHYFLSNPEKSTNLRAYAMFNQYLNAISTETRELTEDTYINGVLVQGGAQVTSPVNVDGKISLRVGANYAFPLTALKTNMSVGVGYNFSNMPSVYNSRSVASKNNGGNVRLQFSSNISENIDFTLSSRTSLTYTESSNTSTMNTTNLYVTENVGAKVNWIFFKGFFVNVDYSYNFNHYSSNAPQDPNFNLLNAGVGKKFLKSQNLELRLSGFDLLDQSKALSHTVKDIYVEDSRSNVLQRYLMMTLSFKFNTMKGKAGQTAASSSFGSNPHSSMGGRPPMGMGGGHM